MGRRKRRLSEVFARRLAGIRELERPGAYNTFYCPACGQKTLRVQLKTYYESLDGKKVKLRDARFFCAACGFTVRISGLPGWYSKFEAVGVLADKIEAGEITPERRRRF